MKGNSPAWITVISSDDLVSSGIRCGELIRRRITDGAVIAIVSPVVRRDVVAKLQTTFDYVIVGEDGIVEKHLESRDALLLQTLKFSSFTKVLVVDPSVMTINETELLDNNDILMMHTGEWKVVALTPNVSKWKAIVDIVTKNSLMMGSDDFINLVSTHYGGNVKQLDCWTPNISEVDGLRIPDLDPDSKTWVAIVGMSCRFPGANSVEEYWDILKNGINTASPPSQHRVSLSNLGANVKANYLKCPVDQFDAHFFGMAPSEAALTDVQARLLLEVSWEAFEDAGTNVDNLRGSSTGIFHGSWIQDYKECLNNVHPPAQDFFRKYIGNSLGGAAGKLSFFYGFTGPSIGTDSACSSSMIAVELACKSLLERECPLALATGSNIILQYDTLSKVVWAEDGICKTFDINANGYGRGEGVAALVLKRYSDAIRDNDRIHGIIRGSASSQEGLSRSFGTPTVESEAMAMKNALLKSGVKPEQVGYVEAHATGTGVGDPIEAAAIVKAYSSSLRTTPMWIGSGKTNIGHTESCSGLAALIKVVLALKHDLIPPHINLKQLNPKVNFEEIPGKIPTEAVAWTSVSGKARVAGVSNFGITGTDVHMIIQEAPKYKEKEENNGPRIHLLTLSAKTEEALQELTKSYIKLLQNPQFEDDTLGNIAYTSNARRTHHSSSRRVALGRTKSELIASLQQSFNNYSGQRQLESLKVCMFFSNETLQSPITRSYYSSLSSTSQFFSKQMSNCDRICKNIMGLIPSDYLTSEGDDDSEMQDKKRQVCSFSVSLSLYKMWESWGVEPNLIFAHGLGQLAGKVATNLITTQEAFKLIAESTNLIKELQNQNTTGGALPYFAFESEEIEPATLNAAANDNGCQICIQVGLENSAFFPNESKISHLPQPTDIGSSLETAERPWLSLFSTLAALYESGYNINWEGFYGAYRHQFQLVSLPHYPFQRKSYWFRRKATTTTPKEISPEWLHPLLGVHFTNAVNPTLEKTYQNWLAVNSVGILQDHVIGNEVIFPAAGYLEMALAAQNLEQGVQAAQTPIVIENFIVHRPLHFEMGQKKTIQTIFSPSAGISIYGLELENQGTSGNWNMYASCESVTTTTAQISDLEFQNQIDLEILKTELERQPDNLQSFYGELAKVGIQFGPRFQTLRKVVQRQGETLAQLVRIPEAELGDYICHPLLIDAMFQCFILAKEPVPTTLQVPVAIQKFTCISRTSSIVNQELYVYTKGSQAETVQLLDSKNNVIAIMHKPILKKTTAAAVLSAAGVNRKIWEAEEPGKFEIYWKPTPNSSQPASFLLLEETVDYTDTPNFSSLLQYFATRNGFSRREKQLDEKINRLVTLYVLNALYELGWQPGLNKSIGLGELAVNLKVLPAYIPAFCHMFSYVSSVIAGKLSRNDIKREIEQILNEQTSQYPALQEIIHPCGSQMAAVFKGEVKIQDAVGTELSELYWETGRFFNEDGQVISKVFTEVAGEMWGGAGGYESGKVMRILDVGNYSRRFVNEIFVALDEDDVEYEYWMTSTSSDTESTARGNVKLIKLDIDRNPLDDGLPPSHFDIVIVRNTFHRIKNCRKAMENLKQLTKLGGILIFEEMNGYIPELDLVLGLSENYWNREDLDIRPSHCAMDVESWVYLMEKVGFHCTHKIFHSGGKMGVIVSQLRICQLEEEMSVSIKTQEKSWLLICTNKNKMLEDLTKRFLMDLGIHLLLLTLNETKPGFVEEFMQNHKENLEGIVFMVEDESGMEPDNCTILLKPLLQVSKCLIKFPWKRWMPKLIVATKGCSPVAATLWGFVRTAQFEIPGLSSKLIELDPECEIKEALRTLFDELWRSNDDESEIRYRNGIRSARRLQKSKGNLLKTPVSESGESRVYLHLDGLTKELRENLFDSQSTCIITGGKGAIGLAIAEWMVARGAKYLVLLGRSPPSGESLKIIQRMEGKEAKILCLEVDISNYEQCQKVIEDIESTLKLPPLRGIHHCAGVLADMMIIHQEWEDFEHVLAPKVKGAYNLHKLTVGKSLQFFVLHSSMSATLGNAGQSNYTAANAYMEALAEMRHKMGLPGLCVSWGQWNAGLGEKLEMKAFHAFTIEQGIQALEQLFWENKEQPCVAVGSIKWEEVVKLRPLYEKTLLEELVADVQNFSPRIEKVEKGNVVNELQISFLEEYKEAKGEQEKKIVIKKLVKNLLCDTLGVAPQQIENDVQFSNMGMDSMLSIEFYSKVQVQLANVKLGFVDMDEYGTLTKMGELIKRVLDGSAKEN